MVATFPSSQTSWAEGSCYRTCTSTGACVYGHACARQWRPSFWSDYDWRHLRIRHRSLCDLEARFLWFHKSERCKAHKNWSHWAMMLHKWHTVIGFFIYFLFYFVMHQPVNCEDRLKAISYLPPRSEARGRAQIYRSKKGTNWPFYSCCKYLQMNDTKTVISETEHLLIIL